MQNRRHRNPPCLIARPSVSSNKTGILFAAAAMRLRVPVFLSVRILQAVCAAFDLRLTHHSALRWRELCRKRRRDDRNLYIMGQDAIRAALRKETPFRLTSFSHNGCSTPLIMVWTVTHRHECLLCPIPGVLLKRLWHHSTPREKQSPSYLNLRKTLRISSPRTSLRPHMARAVTDRAAKPIAGFFSFPKSSLRFSA